MEIAVLSVVYRRGEKYFPEFLFSLAKQSDKTFSLFLVNDGLPDIEKFIQRVDFKVNVLNVFGEKPAKLRKMGIRWVMESGAKIIIFADIDDYFSENRIEISRKILGGKNLIFNELFLIGKEFVSPLRMLGDRFNEGAIFESVQIKLSNCMGLTNTAMRVNSIPTVFEQIPDDIIAFDWAFFALCLHFGVKGIFTKKTATYYRQHEYNMANPCNFQEKQILQGVKVKKDHYRFLATLYNEYGALSDSFNELWIKLNSDRDLRMKYCRAVREEAPAISLWWEPIKLLEELGL